MTQSKIRSLFLVVRPYQYVKNLLVLAPVFFGMQMMNWDSIVTSVFGFVLMCLASSGVYVLNDIFDRDADRLHPKKRLRPIASGDISVREGVIIVVLLWVTTIVLSVMINVEICLLISAYILINVLYSYKLKHIAIIDVLIISLGFVLRLKLGSVLSGMESSVWLILLTFLLSLLIAFGKRRDDVLLFNSTGKKMREVLDGYNLVFIDVSMGVICAVTVVTYLLYTVERSVASKLYGLDLSITSLFIVAGMLRYLQLVYVYQESGSPTKLLYQDRFLQFVVVIWLIVFALILYL